MYMSEITAHSLTLRVAAAIRSFGAKSSIIADSADQLSPPECASWTGENYQLALCRSGNSLWLELRGFATIGGRRSRVVVAQEHNAARFRDFLQHFFTADTGEPADLPSLWGLPL